MPTKIEAPETARQAAARALDLNRTFPLRGVYGTRVAEALVSGSVSAEILERMARFFATNKVQLDEAVGTESEEDNEVVRSFLLHGAESGQALCAGYESDDPVDDLFTLPVAAVQERLTESAWIYEYDLTPADASRFVLEYLKRTGSGVDIEATFQDAASAVGSEVYRRYAIEDPVAEVADALDNEDPDYADAAQDDLEELTAANSPTMLTEALAWNNIVSLNKPATAKMVWPGFVAYFILAVEKPALLKDVNHGKKPPPVSSTAPVLGFRSYTDVVNTAIMFFSEHGAHYVDPTADETFTGVDDEILVALRKAYFGQHLDGAQVRKLLGRARRWTAKNGYAGSLFHVYNADWGKGNWQHILDAIPMGDDVRAAFETFAKVKEKPAHGIKLQQTLKDAKTKAAVAKLFPTGHPLPVPIGDTKFGKACAGAETPVGVYSVVRVEAVAGNPHGFATVLGAYKDGATTWIVVRRTGDKLEQWEDIEAASWVDDGYVTVVQAHVDHPGTGYGKPDTIEPLKFPDATLDQDAIKKAQQDMAKAAGIPPHLLNVSAPKAPDVPIANTGPVKMVGPVLAFLIDTFGEVAHKFIQVAPAATTASTAWIDVAGGDMIAGTTLKRVSDGALFDVVAAYHIHDVETEDEDGNKHTVNDTIIVFKHGQEYVFESSDDVVEHIEKKLFVPKTTEVPKPAPPKYKPKYKVGDVVENSGGTNRWHVIAVLDGGYIAATLRLNTFPMNPEIWSLQALDNHTQLVKSGVGVFEVAGSLMRGDFKVVTVPMDAGWPVLFAKVNYEGKSGFLCGACVKGGTSAPIHPILGQYATWPVSPGHPEAMYLKATVLPADTFKAVVKSSYNPPKDAPEPSVIDATAPVVEMCGTQEAIDKATKLGWTMATKSESASFKWNLGDVLKYGDKTRDIIGYGFNASKAPIYVIKTEKGIVNFKTTAEGNSAYGPLIGTSVAIIDVLKPKPGVAGFPKLNYKLSSQAITVAKHNNLVYVNAPKPSAFYVGSKLLRSDGGVFLLLGWIEGPPSKKVVGSLAVLLPADSTTAYIVSTAEDLAGAFSLQYEHSTTFDPPGGIFTFGKTKVGIPLAVMAPGAVFPSALPEGWDSPASIGVAPFPELEQGQHASAGIVVVLPPGTNIGDGVNTTHALHDPAVVMVHPLNGFGGYKLTFPKGTIDKGESIEKAAVREVYEETGITAKPVGLLGMFKGNNSVTAMFAGYATGGNPHKAGKETDAVTARVLTGFNAFNLAKDSSFDLISKWAWAKDLAERDRNILAATIHFLKTSGMPQAHYQPPAETDSQVTLPQDTVGKVKYGKSFQVKQPDFKGGVSTLDYDPGTEATTWLNNEFPKMMWSDAAPFINKGYPPPGVTVSIPSFEHLPVGQVVGYAVSAVTGGATLERMLLRDPITGGFIAPMLSIISPDQIHPAVTQETAKQAASVPADTTDEEAWEVLYKKMPFPMTTGMVSALKRAWLSGPVAKHGESTTPVGFEGLKSLVGGIAYGSGFKNETGEKFIAMGYINVKGSKVGHGFQLSIGADGDADVFELPASLVSDSDITDASKIPDPWYVHPDPIVNATIKKAYANGGDLVALGVSMKTFKEKWLKEAGVPYYAVASYTILTDIAALFVPGVASKAQFDAVVACLKKRMQLTQKKGKKDLAAAPTPPVNTVSSAPAYLLPTQWMSDEMAEATEIAASSELTYSKGVAGGSKPNYIGVDPKGHKWFVKPAPSSKERFRPHTDVAAAALCTLIAPTVPVKLTSKDGQPASIQPLIEGAVQLVDGDYGGMSDADKGAVLAQHAADMFIGDHDGHFGNWMRGQDGKLYAIDKGQAFKFILQDAKESLDPSWNAPGNFGVHLAKKLLREWGMGQTTIPPSAFAAFKQAIDKVVAIPDSKLDAVLNALAVGSLYTASTYEKLKSELKHRRTQYAARWTIEMAKLAQQRGETWKWGTTHTVKQTVAPTNVPDVIPIEPSAPVKPMELDKAAKDLGFGVKEATVLSEVNQARWRGKSLQIDSDAIENQEVHVKRVKYSSTESPETTATLIHFRVARAKGLAAESVLNQKAKVVNAAGAAAGPVPLPFDSQGSGEKYWGIIQAGVKTINYHLVGKAGQAPDGKPNPETIKRVAMILPELQSIRDQTKDPKGKYEGVSNEAANLMATAYIGYCETILSMAANAAQLIGQKAETMFQFLWQEKKEPAKPDASDEDLVIKKILKSGFSPSSSPAGDEVALKGTDSPLWSPGSGSAQSQFMIEVKSVPGARLYYAPPHGESGYSDIRAYFGQAWAVIPGAPSPAQVATLLKVFEKATGLSMSVASPDDNEFLYLSKQAFLLQDTGDGVKPDQYGVAVNDISYKAATQLYAKGHVKEAVKALRSHVAEKLGTTPESLSKVPGYDTVQKSNVGGGYARHYRLGWTRQKLIGYLGPVFMAHAVTGKTLAEFFKQTVAHNGALLANTVKPYHGIPIGGTGSPGADMLSGGAASIFGAMRPGFMSQHGILYFDPSVYLRTDVYIVGSGDAFGNVTETRYTTPESWKKHGVNKSHGSVSTGSSWQVNVRHDLDLRTYLHTAIFETVEERDAVRKLCGAKGWVTFANGRTLEQVIVKRGDETL